MSSISPIQQAYDASLLSNTASLLTSVNPPTPNTAITAPTYAGESPIVASNAQAQASDTATLLGSFSPVSGTNSTGSLTGSPAISPPALTYPGQNAYDATGQQSAIDNTDTLLGSLVLPKPVNAKA